jgi:hypothetical protein
LFSLSLSPWPSPSVRAAAEAKNRGSGSCWPELRQCRSNPAPQLLPQCPDRQGCERGDGPEVEGSVGATRDEGVMRGVEAEVVDGVDVLVLAVAPANQIHQGFSVITLLFNRDFSPAYSSVALPPLSHTHLNVKFLACRFSSMCCTATRPSMEPIRYPVCIHPRALSVTLRALSVTQETQ